MRFIRRIGDVIAVSSAAAGIRLDKLHPHRILLIVLNVLLFMWILESISFMTGLAYFLIVFITRYIFLFASFIPNGIADRLIRRFGEERGYEIYETATATMFFHGGAGFSCLLEATRWQMSGMVPEHPGFLGVAGTVLSLVGFTVNVWSTLVVGVDIYYYKDLFLRRFITDFKEEGPYRFLSNPMYGVGQSAAYGAACSSGSIAGVIATGLNQMMMYLFYFLIEKPHIRRLLAGKADAGAVEREAEPQQEARPHLKPAEGIWQEPDTHPCKSA